MAGAQYKYDPILKQDLPLHMYFGNENIRRRIYENGTSEEIEELRVYHNLTLGQIELFVHSAKLRRRTLDYMKLELAKRKADNPKATDEEFRMGTYIEDIEPQVRDAVLSMRRKGYNTYLSGFLIEAGQSMMFHGDPVKDFDLPQQLAIKLNDQNVRCTIKPNSIVLKFGSKMDLDQIKKIWDQITESLPDLGNPAPIAEVSSAQRFRRKQSEMN